MSEPLLYGPGRRGPLPLIVGVTGDIDPVPSTELRDVLGKLKKRYRHTPLVLLAAHSTSLGRVAAEVASEMNCRHFLLLPQAKDAYLNGCAESVRDRYAQQLDQAERLLV